MTDARSVPAAAGVYPLPHSEIGEAYDRLPYPSMPFPETQPLHLAALAMLFGMAPPSPEYAHVLELGCASGGNIIPLAARHPDATFLGIDLSRRHVDDGCRRIAELDLPNVTLEQADLTSLDLGGRQFDYILCNGVFSWVPDPTRAAILRMCQRALRPNGMIAISYNVFPGWHLRMVVRDLCRHYAGTEGKPRDRVARARAALERIAAGANEYEPYGALLRTEARRLKDVPASYILGEFLAPDNTPCTITDFVAQAARHGLYYLCELDLCAALPQSLLPAMQACMAGSDTVKRLELEQRVDHLTGRLFRRSVLVREPSQTGATPAFVPNRLRKLHISSPIRLDEAQSESGRLLFKDPRGRSITMNNPKIGAAIGRLQRAYPATLAYDELVASGANETADPATAQRILGVLQTLVLGGLAHVSSAPLRVGGAADTRPCAWRVSRVEAAAGQPWITSLRHVGVPLSPVLRRLLPDIDGTRDRGALRACLKAAVQDGVIVLPELTSAAPHSGDDGSDSVFGEYVERCLSYLALHSLLAPASVDADRAGRSST